MCIAFHHAKSSACKAVCLRGQGVWLYLSVEGKGAYKHKTWFFHLKYIHAYNRVTKQF